MKAAHHRRHIIFYVLVLVSALLLIRFSLFIATHSADLLFMDQWPLYGTFMDSPSLGALFRTLYGPHRMGLGYILTYAVATASGWSVSMETLLNVLVYVLGFLALLFLKYRLFRRWHWSDSIFPVLLFSFKYYESFFVTPDISLAVLPVTFIIILALIWTLDSPVKYPLFSAVGILTIYSGFGILITPWVLLLLAAEWVHKKGKIDRWYIGSALFLFIAGIVSFFWDYKLDTAIDCSINPIENWTRYPFFIGIFFLNYFWESSNFTLLNALEGYIVFALLCFYFIEKTVRYIHERPQQDKLFGTQMLFIGTTVTFAVVSAIGRTCLGFEAAKAARYLLYQVPLYIALYFTILTFSDSARRRLCLAVFVLTLMASEVFNQAKIMDIASNYITRKRAWSACYLRKESITACNAETDFIAYPTYLIEEQKRILMYEKDRHLNIFLKQSTGQKD